MPGMGAMIVTAMLLAGASADDRLSWGRPGVSLEDYRREAVACNKAGGLMDIRSADATKRFVQATELQERNLNLSSQEGPSLEQQQLVRRAFNPARQVDRVQALQVSTVEQCLVKSGYRQFRLTRSQKKQLDRLPRGSVQRHAYLHSLASDPSVLDIQRVN